MIAGPVRAGRRVDMVEPAQDLELMFNGSERLHGAGQLKFGSFAVGPPGRLDGAIGEIDKCHAQRCAGGGGGQFRAGGEAGFDRETLQRTQRFKCRQRDAGAESAQKMPPAERGQALCGPLLGVGGRCWSFHGYSFRAARCLPAGAGVAGTLALRRFWNGADSMTPISRAEKRPWSASSRLTIWSMVKAS